MKIDLTRTRQILDSEKSATCPACSGVKLSGMAVCLDCYRHLPVEVRVRLYERKHYERTFHDAMASLRIERPDLPAPRTKLT